MKKFIVVVLLACGASAQNGIAPEKEAAIKADLAGEIDHVGETNWPRSVSPFATRTCPYAGNSIAISTTACSTSGATRFFGHGFRRLISFSAGSPPFSYKSRKR